MLFVFTSGTSKVFLRSIFAFTSPKDSLFIQRMIILAYIYNMPKEFSIFYEGR